jgi:YegS/Rv2252/BmrU family lipid kinase
MVTSAADACVILNPVSGGVRRGGDRERRVRAWLSREQADVRFVKSEAPGHARQLALEALASGYRRVVAVGGDGTMNEVATALANTGADFGLVPTGSGNGLARHLHLPLGLEKALEVALKAPACPIDTGLVNGYRFCNVMGMGFDAEIGRIFNTSTRRGLVAYLQAILRAFLKYPLKRYRVCDDSGAREVPAFLLTVANSTQYGNNARIAPAARVDDGILDLVAVTSRHPKDCFGVAVRLFTGAVAGSPHVVCRRSNRFTIEREEDGLIHTDGEIHEAGRILTVEVESKSLRVAGACPE